MATDETYADLTLIDGILHFVYKPIPCINLKIAQEVVAARLRFQEGKSYPVLCDLRAVGGADKQARDYLAGEGSLFTEAQAFLVESSYTQEMLIMYLGTSAVETNAQIFREVDPAINFLKQYRKCK